MTQLPKQVSPYLATAWLKDPLFDLSFIFGITLLAFGMATATIISPALFIPMLTLHIWALGYDHVLATLTKLAGLPEDRARNRFLIFGLPILILVGMTSLGMRLGVVALNSLYLFGQLFHTTRQSWGLAQQYRHKAGGLPWDNVYLSELTLWALPIWGILNRCHQQPSEFLYQDIWMPQVPLWLVQVAGVLCIALLIIWLLMRVRAYRKGQLAIGHTLYLLTHFVVFAFSYLIIDDVNSGWLLVNVWHNAQYLVFVWLHNRQRFASGVRSDAKLLSWLSQPGTGRATLYYVTLMVVATPFYLLLYRVGAKLDSYIPGRLVSMVLVLSLTLNFHHYLVDGIIWKRKRQLSSDPSQLTAERT